MTRKIVITSIALIFAITTLSACSIGGGLSGLSGKGSETTTTSEITTATTSETTTAKKADTTTATSVATATTAAAETTTFFEPDPDAGKGTDEPEPDTTEHEHVWERIGGGAPGCEAEGTKSYVCYECGETYVEYLPALGHDFQLVFHQDATCYSPGFDSYKCTRCDLVADMNQEMYPQIDHDMSGIKPDYSNGRSEIGHINYCTMCGIEDSGTFEYHDLACYPMDGEESVYHVYYCDKCGYSGTDIHHMIDGICAGCGYTGPLG